MLLPLFFLPATAFAADEIKIENLQLNRKDLDRYFLKADVTNATQEPREVVLRSQVSFYDRDSPQGDVPAAILRKDTTLVIKSRETRHFEQELLNEGSVPQGDLRLEPMLRVRRQRPWSY